MICNLMMTKIKEIDGGALHGRRFLVLVFF
jgi:hypothetical protein